MKAKIRELLHASPFRAFIIRTEDGRKYRIDRPDSMLASPSEVPQVVIEELDGRTHFLSTLLMTSIDLAPARRRRGTGR